MTRRSNLTHFRSAYSSSRALCGKVFITASNLLDCQEELPECKHCLFYVAQPCEVNSADHDRLQRLHALVHRGSEL